MLTMLILYMILGEIATAPTISDFSDRRLGAQIVSVDETPINRKNSEAFGRETADPTKREFPR